MKVLEMCVFDLMVMLLNNLPPNIATMVINIQSQMAEAKMAQSRQNPFATGPGMGG